MSVITVKKANGSTDIDYTLVQPAGGDNTPAIWKSQSVGAALAHQPELRLTARASTSGQARNETLTYMYPQIATDTTTGLTSVVNKAQFELRGSFPNGMAQVDIDEAVAQFFNLGDSATIVAAFKQRSSVTS